MLVQGNDIYICHNMPVLPICSIDQKDAMLCYDEQAFLYGRQTRWQIAAD